MKTSLLILDDDPLCLETAKAVLAPLYQVHTFTKSEGAFELLKKKAVSVAILDLHLLDENGLDLIQSWKKHFPDVEFIFCSGETNVECAINCIRHGASDYIVKPYQSADLLCVVQRALEKHLLKKRVQRLSPLVNPMPVKFTGSTNVMKDVLEKVQLLKHQSHLNVLILGESGTGKEIIARLLHQQEVNPERPFVVVNMPAIPASLMEAELFGVEKGAYTDAKASRPGKFELADGGDIFLDEIGDLPMETQAKILRTLQERQVERVGSGSAQQVQFRAISATNQPLADLMSNGRFREDLMYRLSDLALWLPPLRERKEDIPLLVEHFIQKYSMKTPLPVVCENVLKKLIEYHWPGNIRQLESTIKRALIFNQGKRIEHIELYDPAMLNPGSTPNIADGKMGFESIVAKFEKELIEKTIQRHRGNKHAVMEELQLPRATFYRKLQQLGVLN